MKHFVNRVQRQLFARLILVVLFAVTSLVAAFVDHLIGRFMDPLAEQIVPPASGEFKPLVHSSGIQS